MPHLGRRRPSQSCSLMLALHSISKRQAMTAWQTSSSEQSEQSLWPQNGAEGYCACKISIPLTPNPYSMLQPRLCGASTPSVMRLVRSSFAFDNRLVTRSQQARTTFILDPVLQFFLSLVRCEICTQSNAIPIVGCINIASAASLAIPAAQATNR